MRALLPWARRAEQSQGIPVLNQEDTCDPKCLYKAGTETCREGLSRIKLQGDNMREVIMARCSWASGGGHQSLSQGQSPPPPPWEAKPNFRSKTTPRA